MRGHLFRVVNNLMKHPFSYYIEKAHVVLSKKKLLLVKQKIRSFCATKFDVL